VTDLTERTRRAVVLRTDAEAIAVARRLADDLAPGAAQRDAEGAIPIAEAADLARSGLLGATVPAGHGGADVSRETLAEILRILAIADPAIAQTPQTHFGTIEAIRANGTPHQRETFFAGALRGERIAGIGAERGGPRADIGRTRLTAGRDGTLRLRGAKFYSTGALTADWLAVLALDDADERVSVLVPADAPGVVRHDDWDAFGQRATTSGSTTFAEVPVDPRHVLPGFGSGDAPQILGATAQLMHAAIHVGIARGALEDGAAHLRAHARPWHEAGVDHAVEEPHLIAHVGRLATRVDAAEALLLRAARTLDDTRSAPLTRDSTARASLAVAQAKAFGAEAALDVSTQIFEGAGASATDRRYALDRHWRNARTHTLHDPLRWKYHHVGAYVLSGTRPPNHGQL
jgi:SfnB family sulfur acquisition oxidoreductase